MYNPRMRKTLLVLASLLVCATASAQVADGDQQWAARAEGHQGGHAKADHINAAIAAYQKAVQTNANDLDARWKLLRAYRFKGASPFRVLGRLHDQTPHVPFITGWASSKEAVRFLNESIKVDPTNKITQVFLAEAMVSNNSDTKPQAIQMLKATVAAPNNPEYEVEQQAATDDAKALLKKWGA